MNRKDKLYWVILLLLALTAFLSVSLIIFFQRRATPLILGKKKGNGSFTIEGVREAAVNIPFKMQFIANSDKMPVNAVSLSASFDTNKLTVLNVDTSKSFCQFYPENKFNNSKGQIIISCGAPSPGFTGKNTIAEITFIAKSQGETSVTVSEESQILLNDGKGTDIFSKPVSFPLLIINRI